MYKRQAIHLLKSGDHAIVGDDIYGGTHRLFSEIMTQYGIEFTFTRLNSRENIEEAIQPNTKMLWIETPSNPLLNITDMELVADIAKEHQLLTVADNTFPSPYFLRPVSYTHLLYEIKVYKIFEAVVNELKGVTWEELMEASAIITRRETGKPVTAKEYEQRIKKSTFGEAIWATGGLEKFFVGFIAIGELVIARKVAKARK